MARAMACALYCSVDPTLYGPQEASPSWDLGYIGTYSDDRQPTLEELAASSPRAACRARQFCRRRARCTRRDLDWAGNVERFDAPLAARAPAPSTVRSASRSTSRAPT